MPRQLVQEVSSGVLFGVCLAALLLGSAWQVLAQEPETEEPVKGRVGSSDGLFGPSSVGPCPFIEKSVSNLVSESRQAGPLLGHGADLTEPCKHTSKRPNKHAAEAPLSFETSTLRPL